MVNAPFQRDVTPGKYSVPIPGKSETCMWAIAALVCAFVMPLLGIIFAIVALVKINENPNLKGKGLAIAALVVSLIWLPIMALVFIGTIAYFGVLNPESFLPNICSFSMGLDCLEAPYADRDLGTIVFSLTNNLGYQVTDMKVSSSCPGGTVEPIAIDNGQSAIVTLSGCSFIGDHYSEDVGIIYTSSATGMTHTGDGRVAGEI
jgi:hypothetical protein